MIRFALALLALGPSTALACGAGGEPMRPDVKDHPVAVIILDPPPMAQPFSMQVQVCADNVSTLSVDATMPAHQHGMNYTPQITTLGDGLFQIDGMVFHMPGEWEIRVSADHDGGSAGYTHTVTLK